MNFVATFYTHLAALRTARALEAAGVRAVLAPVPRALSSSCGTCVFYGGDAPLLERMDADTEAVYRRRGDGGYERLLKNE